MCIEKYKNLPWANNVFKFHNVGQGLFYTGSILGKGRDDWFNFVFDCGSTKLKAGSDAVSDYVNNLPIKDEERYIDMVIISHLDSDHFNGLVELASKAKINKLYLPYLPDDPDFIKLFLLYVIFFEQSDDEEDFDDKRVRYKFMLKLYNVKIEDDSEFNRIKFPNEVHFEKDKKIEDIYDKNPYWRFELYESLFDEKIIDSLKNEVGKSVGDLDGKSLIDFVFDKKNINTIETAYKNVFHKKKNLTSMILVHYPVSSELVKSVCYSAIDCKLNLISKCFLEPNDMRYVSVLTGDAEDFEKYDGFAESVNKKKVFCLQVPHHGSKENWKSLNSKFGMKLDNGIRYVLPFGIGNSYGHPSIEVLDDLDDKQYDYYFATQYSAFEYKIEVLMPVGLALKNGLL
ncbi:MAG: hypothetical protein K2M75_00140 [Clostridia bacterium]|nr:hypothetical protein [Clostridia bacterium]